jgi:hypothetical protein
MRKMTKKRFGKYVSRVKRAARPRLKKGGSISVPDAKPPLPPGQPEEDKHLEPLGDDEQVLREVALEPLYAPHRSLAINHGFRPAFAYRAPADIDLHAMATAIRDKHVRPTAAGHRNRKMASKGLHGKHLGGGVDWDMVGKKFGHAAVFAGEVGLAGGAVATLINPAFGAGLMAVSAGAVGVGAAVGHAYGEKMVSI